MEKIQIEKVSKSNISVLVDTLTKTLRATFKYNLGFEIVIWNNNKIGQYDFNKIDILVFHSKDKNTETHNTILFNEPPVTSFNMEELTENTKWFDKLKLESQLKTIKENFEIN